MTSEKKPQYLKQGISLTGLGTPSFQKAIDNVYNLFAIFARNVPQGKLQLWSPQEHDGVKALDLSNRIFTSRRDDPTGKAIAMGPLIDPGEKLLSLAGDSLFYGEENVVAYGRRVLEEDQAVRWVVVQKKKKPDTYRLFQIHCDSSRKLPDRGHSRGEGVDGCIPYSWKGSAPNPHIEKYNADGPGLHHGE